MAAESCNNPREASLALPHDCRWRCSAPRAPWAASTACSTRSAAWSSRRCAAQSWQQHCLCLQAASQHGGGSAEAGSESNNSTMRTSRRAKTVWLLCHISDHTINVCTTIYPTLSTHASPRADSFRNVSWRWDTTAIILSLWVVTQQRGVACAGSAAGDAHLQPEGVPAGRGVLRLHLHAARGDQRTGLPPAVRCACSFDHDIEPIATLNFSCCSATNPL